MTPVNTFQTQQETGLNKMAAGATPPPISAPQVSRPDPMNKFAVPGMPTAPQVMPQDPMNKFAVPGMPPPLPDRPLPPMDRPTVSARLDMLDLPPEFWAANGLQPPSAPMTQTQTMQGFQQPGMPLVKMPQGFGQMQQQLAQGNPMAPGGQSVAQPTGMFGGPMLGYQDFMAAQNMGAPSQPYMMPQMFSPYVQQGPNAGGQPLSPLAQQAAQSGTNPAPPAEEDPRARWESLRQQRDQERQARRARFEGLRTALGRR